MRIGFDISMTHQQKAGCAWVADQWSRALVRERPDHRYFFFDHFLDWYNASVRREGPVAGGRVSYPLRHLSEGQIGKYWNQVRRTGQCRPAVDIVHSNNFQSCKLTTAKLVYTVYDVSFWVHPEFSTESNRLACQKGLLRALGDADGLVYISHHAREELHRILPGVVEKRGIKECVVHLGPAHSLEDSGAPAADRGYWLQVGTLEPRKNHAAVLDALEIYWERSPRRLPLKIVGGPGWKSEELIRRISALEQSGKAHYLGYVPDAQMPALYRGASAFLFPSWYEGFGLPVLEAMGLGCPVISSSTASLPEVGGDAVSYIEPGCPGQIAEAMLRLEGNPALRTAMVEKGRKQAARFSWSQSARCLADFYQQVFTEK